MITRHTKGTHQVDTARCEARRIHCAGNLDKPHRGRGIKKLDAEQIHVLKSDVCLTVSCPPQSPITKNDHESPSVADAAPKLESKVIDANNIFFVFCWIYLSKSTRAESSSFGGFISKQRTIHVAWKQIDGCSLVYM